MSLWSLSATALRDALGSKRSYSAAELITCCCRAGSVVGEEWTLLQPALLLSCEFLQISQGTEDAFGVRQRLLQVCSQMGTFPTSLTAFSALLFPGKAPLHLTRCLWGKWWENALCRQPLLPLAVSIRIKLLQT